MYPGPGSDDSRGGSGSDNGGISSPGNDVWWGGPGSDYLTDFAGNDLVQGGGGSDRCLATVDTTGGDTIRGGPGRDFWDADPGDVVSGVERQAVCYAD